MDNEMQELITKVFHVIDTYYDKGKANEIVKLIKDYIKINENLIDKYKRLLEIKSEKNY